MSFAKIIFPSVPDLSSTGVSGFLYGFIWRISSRQQVRLVFLAFLIFPLSMIPLELQRRIVDDALTDRNVNLLFMLGAAYLGVLLLHSALKYLYSVYQASVGEGAIRCLRLGVNARLEGNRRASGSNVSVATAESEQVGGFVGEALSEPLLQGGILLTILCYMLWLEPVMAIVATVSVIPSVIVTPLVQQRINRLISRRIETIRNLSGRIVEPDNDNDGRCDTLVRKVYRVRIRIFLLKFLLKGINNLLAALGPLGILLVGGWLVIQGDTGLGVVVAFLSGFERLTSPVRELLNFYRRVSQVIVQYELVGQVLGRRRPDRLDHDRRVDRRPIGSMLCFSGFLPPHRDQVR